MENFIAGVMILNKTREHANLCKQILMAISKEHPEVVAIEFDAGYAYAKHLVEKLFAAISMRNFSMAIEAIKGVKARPIRYGVPGYPDIHVISWGARWIGMEIKTGAAVMSPGQKNFARRVKDIEAVVHEVRSVEQALEILEQYKRKEIA